MTTEEMTYIRAVNEALGWALTKHPEVVVFGEDVAIPNGPFGATKGLRDRFGARVFDTPISESAMVGAALGAAVCGLRPVVEVMYGDFLLVAMDQIINQIANARYVSRGRLIPRLVIRSQQGATPGSCAQHSQSLEALFAHVPGLRVGLPATPRDAFQMLRAAVVSDDPVMILEARRLYATKGEVELDAPLEQIGGARVVAAGDDVTVVTWGTAVADVLIAREQLSERGIGCEIIDLRWLSPLDLGSVFESLTRTRRLAVVHEANRTGGFGAEVVARVTEAGLTLLRPPLRIAAKDSRVPSSPALSSAILPNPAGIAHEVAAMLNGGDGAGAEPGMHPGLAGGVRL